MLSGFGLFFLGAFKRLLKLLSVALAWLLEDWRNGPLILFALGFFFLVFVKIPDLQSDVALANEQRGAAVVEREATMDAFEQTVANYLAAAAEAQRLAKANVARVKARQASITQETVNDYEKRLAAVRAHAERLRGQAIRSTPVNPSGASEVDMPSASGAPSGIDGAPADPQLPPGAGRAGRGCPAAFVCLTIDEAEIATNQALQLDALIDWNERQAGLDFNAGPIAGGVSDAER